MLMSNDNRMEVSFISRTLKPHTAKGFKAEYRFVTGLFHICYRFVSHLLQACFTFVTCMFHICYMFITYGIT